MTSWWQPMISFFGSILGGGLIAAIINLWHQSQQRRATFLEAQLQKVYAPTYWLLHKSERMDSLMDRYNEAEKLVAATTEVPSEDMSYSTSLLWKDFYLELRRNLIQIQSVLDQNPLYIDAEDIHLFLELYECTARLNAEVGDMAGPARGTDELAIAVGEFDLVDTDIVNRLGVRFHAKRDMYLTLLGAKSK